MEHKLDELLKQLHRYLFADSEQVIVELRHYMLDRSLKEADLAFVSSKVFNSNESLLQFLRQSCSQNERILGTVKKRLYELIIDYIKLRKQEASHYLNQIKETCMVSFVGDPNSLVKEASLQVLIKIVESFNAEEIQPTINPAKLIETLLDEIKLRRPSATVKGAIWTLIGLLLKSYEQLQPVQAHLQTAQRVLFMMLNEHVKQDKPELKAINGMLKGLQYSFDSGCTLDEAQIQGLFLILKTVIRPIDEVNNRGVMKAGMKLMAQHASLFTDQMMRYALDLIELALKLCVQENLEVRDTANEFLGSVIRQISESLQPDQDVHVQLFRHIMEQFDDILQSNDYRNIQLLSAIRAVGIFSKAIQTILGDEKLWDYIEKLTELSEQRLIKEFMDQTNPQSDLHNFKYILKKQKQLIAYIESYSFIIRNLAREPSERFLQHFMKIGSIGVNNHRKLYNKYRFRFYESLAQLTMSLANFQNPFVQWIKKFVRLSLTETLKIPDSVLYGGESPLESLSDAVLFWKEYLGQKDVWSEHACMSVYDELMQIIISDIERLDLTYKVQKVASEDDHTLNSLTQQSQTQNQQLSLSQDSQDVFHSFQESQRDNQGGADSRAPKKGHTVVSYIANNNYDQQYFERLANFLESFLRKSHDDWLLKWVPTFTSVLVKKATQTPRISKLYAVLKTILKICSKHKYFTNSLVEIQDSGSDVQNTYSMLLTFLKELIGKSEEFQDQLLVRTMQLLLHVPLEILYNREQGQNDENLHLWKGVMIKALELSHQNNSLAMTCINMLEQWFNALPVSLTAELYSDIVPMLSDFLAIEQKNQVTNGQDDEKIEEYYFFQDIIRDSKDEKVDRRDIANKVLDLLGKIGGHAHSIINNDRTKKHDKENFIRWDPEKRLKFTVPLHSDKIDIYLDSCLPRIVELAQNSTDKETRIAACELLHALILYMIGQSATNLQEQPASVAARSEQKAAFAKLYSKLFPVIIRLATEIEQISRQLFEPLCFQLVRWFSRYKISEHTEVEYLLDALIEGAQSRNNYTLREMCSNAVAEFACWSLRHAQTEANAMNENKSSLASERGDSQIVDDTNIRSLIRRIASNSNHPDPFKRLSSVLCFSKIFEVIQMHESLVDEYCMEITRCVLISLKMCHNSLEFCQEVIENCAELLSVVKAQILRSVNLLMQPNPARSVHSSLPEFLDFLFSKSTSTETVYRQECLKLWQGLVVHIQGKTSSQSQQSIQQWIKQRYIPEKKRAGQSSKSNKTYWTINEINFDQQNPAANNLQNIVSSGSLTQESRKGRILENQKNQDQFAAQLQFISWLIKTAGFSLNELKTVLKIDLAVVSGNIQEFFKQVIKPQYARLIKDANPLRKMFICKEDKEQFIKSKIRALMSLFQMMNELQPEELKVLDDYRSEAEEECMDTQEANRLGQLQDELFQLALQIMLVPAAHKLQLLVQDVQLERMLRKSCQEFVKKQAQNIRTDILCESLEQLNRELPVTDLSNLIGESVSNLQPRLLTQLCMGYLKLAEYNPTVKERLNELSSVKLGQVVEEWVKGVQPPEIESTRCLVQFMCKLRIKNEELVSWLTEKSQIYQRTSDLLLAYIADNWSKEPICTGEYIINKAGEDMRLLTVFIPVLEYVSKKVAGYQSVLLKGIPSYWQAARYRDEYAECQIKIFSLIVSKCKWSFENQPDNYSQSFVNFVTSCIITFLPEEKFQVYLKKSVLHLIGLLLGLKLQGMKQTILQKMSPSLINLKKQYFPVKTRELEKNSNKAVNFEHIVEGFLDLVDFSQNTDILRMMYPVLREHKPAFFAERLKNTVSNFVRTTIIKAADDETFMTTFDKFYEEFRDAGFDDSVDDNIRWAIANKILKTTIEWCSLEQLELIMVKYFTQFQGTLAKQFEPGLSPIQWYLQVREKTHILLFLECMIRRLDSERLKNEITKSLYGQMCQGNDLTRYLIVTADKAKANAIEGFLAATRDQIVTEIPVLNSPYQVQRRYICAAYNLLSSVIYKTQTKQNLYSRYLFTSKENCPSIWQQLIDCSSEQIYSFSVQTNFNFVNLKKIEHKIAQYNSKQAQVHNKDFMKAKANNFLSEYVTTSFMSANEKFNSAMVFETQLDEAGMRSERQKVDEIIRKRMSMNPEMGFLSLNSGVDADAYEVDVDMGDQQEDISINSQPQQVQSEAQQQQAMTTKMDKSAENTLEMDIVNKHECMKNIKRSLDKMKDLFSNDWNQAGYGELPDFMQTLLRDAEDPECHLNVKIFILKLLVNNSTLFKPFAQHWFTVICEFIVQKNTGGIGFHYFLRDLATLLVQWSDDFQPSFEKTRERNLCSKVMNTLIKLAADKSKYIFNINIEIVASLMLKWRSAVVLDKTTLCNMLSVPEQKDGSHLWKMNAIQIIALACAFNVPVVSQDDLPSHTQAEHNFHLHSMIEDNKIDPLFKCLLKMQELRKKQLIFASSEALGKILTKQPELVGQALPLLLQNEAKDRDDIFVNVIERITRDFPNLLGERKIFLKLLSFVNILTGSMRGVVFKALDRYIQACPQEDLQEVSKSVQAVFDEILADISDDNQQNFLIILGSIMKLDKDLSRPVLQQVVPRLKPLFIENKNEFSRALFFDIMVNLYDNFQTEFGEFAKSSLIRGLSDPSKEIRERLIAYWSSPQRMSLDCNERLYQLLTELYDLEEEGVWLNNAIYLLLKASESSADFDRPLFTFNLNCSFAPLLINQINLPSLNRQQPVTSSVALLNQIVFSASQAQFHRNNQQQAQQNTNHNSETLRRQKAAAAVNNNNNQMQMGSLPSIREEAECGGDQQMMEENHSGVLDVEMVDEQQQTKRQQQMMATSSLINQPNLKNRTSTLLSQQQSQQSASMAQGSSSQNSGSHLRVVGSSKNQQRQMINTSGVENSQLSQQQHAPLFNLSQSAMPSSLVASHFGGQAHMALKGSSPEHVLPDGSSGLIRDQFNGQNIRNRSGDKPNVVGKSGFRLFQATGEESKDFQDSNTFSQSIAQSKFAQPTLGGPQRSKNTLSKFFKHNDITYTPIQASQGQMIRCIPDGSQPAQLARKADKMRQQREQLIKRHMQLMNRQHKLIRSYRVGDLPDIQINHKDVLMPLMALVRRDSTIATEVFVELFIQIYNETRTEERKELLGKGVQDILASSIKFDYGAISCMHKVAIELLKADQFSVDAEIIARTGKHSMSFQTSLNLLEEMILHGAHAPPVSSGSASQYTAGAVVQSQQQLQATTTFGRIDSSTKAYWFSLVEMYEIIGNQDALYGIRSAMGDSECILVQSQSDSKSKNLRKRRVQQSHSSGSQGAASAAAVIPDEDEYSKTVNLIKQVQSLRSRGSISKGLKVLEETLQSLDAQECFEEQVKQDLQNKRLESLSDLLKWDVIAKESFKNHTEKQLYDIPFQQAQIMIRAMLRRTECWTDLNQMIQGWNNETRSKAYLEQQFNFEQALLQVTAKDFDRARFFINKEANDLIAQWQDMTKLSQIAQHMLVNKIQKVYEMKEFLLTCKDVSLQGQDEMIPKVFHQFKNWIQRQPSYSFDKLAVWDDILTARMLYIDCYQMIFRKDTFDQHLAQLDASQGKDEIRDIGAILYAQCAKGAYKMGMFDSSDRYLKACLDVRKRSSDINQSRGNIRIVLPIVKLKTEQFRQDTMNLSQAAKLDKLETIMSVLTQKLNAVKDSGQILQTDIGSKASLLKQKLESKLIKLVISDLAKGSKNKTLVQKQQDEASHAKLKDFILSAFGSFEQNYQQSPDAEESKQIAAQASQSITGTSCFYKAKFGYRFSKLTDKLLRQMEQNENVRGQLGKILKHVGMNSDQLASMTVKLTFQSINMGYLKASDAIPRLLDVVSKTGSTAARKVLSQEFVKESKDTPAWIFLRWISQLIAVINTSESEMIQYKVIQIVKSYPQALYYPFKVVESNIEVNLLSEEEIETTKLYDTIKKLFEQRYENLNTWTEALYCLVDPQHRARYWLQMIYDCVKERGSSCSQKVNLLLEKMLADVASESKPYVDKQIGSYNTKFVSTVLKYFKKEKLHKADIGIMAKQLQKFDEFIKNSDLKPGFHKLSLFSEYLDMLDNNDFYNAGVYIEIPGQFENAQSQLLSEPIPSKNVKIASIKKELLILGSIKRPKRITAHGSNEKDYHLLIKGGEDLRLDQRVQQLFSIMNKIFKEDPTCLNREIYLKTFAVTPMTNRLGSLEWVDNTEPLKGLINREHMRLENGKGLSDSRAQAGMLKWLKNLPCNKSKECQQSIMKQVVNLLSLEGEDVADGFSRNTKLMRWNLLRNGLENLCLTSAAFITIKNQFIKSMATFSIASYLIGVGDRHLENFLVDTTDGEVFGIDFGIAFGSGVQLAMPELMPFRLTQQIEGVIAPHPLEGAYKQTMVHAMGALRKRKSLILDTCEIFVKEPLLDWVKEAKKVQAERNGNEVDASTLDYDEAMEQLAFYPKKKIEVVKNKLNGIHPSKIMAQELKATKHSKQPYFNRLLYAIQGPKNSTRETLVQSQKQHLEITEQIDCLIEAARDPQILGRAWIGWGAYI